MFKGLLLKESLLDLHVLDWLRVTKTEVWNVENAAEYQPRVWTAIYFELEEGRAEDAAGKLSRALKPAWFINGSTDDSVYVIFPGRIFVYRKGDSTQREAARQFGRTLGIPDGQLDWSE